MLRSKIVQFFAIRSVAALAASATYAVAAPIITVSAPNALVAGQTGAGTVSLSSPAPQGGLIVQVASSAPAIAGVSPAAVSVAEGQTTGSFTYTGVSGGGAMLTASASGFIGNSTYVTVSPLVGVTLSPASTSLGYSRTQQFTSAVSGTYNTGVIWSVSPWVGNFTPNGVYIAPGIIPAVQTLTVTATSVADPSVTATSTITLLPNSPSGLVGYWPLDEGSGTVAYDRSGNGLNGTWQGGQAGNSGFYSGNAGSYAGTFDGKTTSVSLGSQLPNTAGPLTMSVWVRQTALAPAGTNPLIFGNGAANFYLNSEDANVWVHFTTNGYNHYLGKTTGLAEWHMATATYNGVMLSFYLDGVLTGTDTASGLAGAPENLAIGGGGLWSGYPGQISGAQLYNRVLSATEIQALYLSGREVAGAPVNVSATTGAGTALVSFDAPVSNGGAAITSYVIAASPGNIVATATQATPTIVAGLDNGTTYTFTVTAMNSVGASLPSAPTNAVTPALVTTAINWNEIHQGIDGFGASDAFTYPTLTSAQADLFFSPTVGVGLSLLRTAVPNDGSCALVGTACAGSVSDMQLASARGARIFSSPWSPPAYMTASGSTNCTVGTLPSSLLPGSYGTYGSYLANYVQSVQNTGVPLYALSIQNEPDFCANYGGAIWSDVNFHDFIKNNLGPTLAANNLGGTKIMLSESASSSLAGLVDTTMSDPGAANYVGILAYHGYSNPTTINNPYASSGKALWETEVSGFPSVTSTLTTCNGCWDPSIQDGLIWAKVMHHSLVDLGVNAWNYWWLINNGNNDNEGLIRNGIISKRLYVMGNYSRFVRPGWVRIGATENPTPGVYVSAYKDPTNSNLAVIAINTTSSAVTLAYAVNGVTLSSITPWVTSRGNNLAQQGNIAPNGSNFNATLAASSVTTFSGTVAQ